MMWLCNILFQLKMLLSISIWSIYFYMCVTKCDLRLFFWLKPFPQCWHTNGFSPVWVLKCLCSLELNRKFFPQNIQTRPSWFPGTEYGELLEPSRIFGSSEYGVLLDPSLISSHIPLRICSVNIHRIMCLISK